MNTANAAERSVCLAIVLAILAPVAQASENRTHPARAARTEPAAALRARSVVAHDPTHPTTVARPGTRRAGDPASTTRATPFVTPAHRPRAAIPAPPGRHGAPATSATRAVDAGLPESKRTGFERRVPGAVDATSMPLGDQPNPEAAVARTDAPIVASMESTATSAPLQAALPMTGGPATPLVGSRFRIDPANISLGEFSLNEPKTTIVRLLNDSAGPMTLSKVVPTCGCTVAAWAGQVIPPHGDLEVEITAKPGGEPGISFSRRCTFQVDGEPPLTNTITGWTAGPTHPIRCEPAVVDLGELEPEMKKSGVVRLVNTSDRPMRLARFIPPGCGSCCPPRLDVRIEPHGSFELPFTLYPGPRQGVDLAKRGTLQFEGEAPLVFTVKGHVAEHIAIEPLLVTADPVDPESGRIRLRSLDGTPFKILDVIPPIVADVEPAARSQHIVHVDWKRWAESGSGVKLTFAVDHPQIERVSVLIKRQLAR